MILMGVDIGGTKIAAGLVDFNKHPTVLIKRSWPTPTTGPADIIADVTALIRELETEFRAGGGNYPADSAQFLAGVGIGAPGIIDPRAGRVTAASKVVKDWVDTDIAGPVAQHTALPVFVDNDVRAMGRAEARYGSGRDLDSCLYVSLGTGIGGAISRRMGGRGSGIIRGSHGSAGEIAHLIAPCLGSIRCGCGHDQHLEAILSGPAMSAEYSRRVGEQVDLREVGRRLDAGDEIARAVVHRAGSIAGEVLAGTVSAFDLDGVVIGGGAIDVGPQLLDSLSSHLSDALWPPARQVTIRRTELGEDSPIIGAAVVAHESLES